MRSDRASGAILVVSEGLRPSDSRARALARRSAGSLPPPQGFGAKAGRSRGSLAALARAHVCEMTPSLFYIPPITRIQRQMYAAYAMGG